MIFGEEERVVTTENHIRAGADAAMGYPRFGMVALLNLLSGLIVGAFRSHAAREAEMAFLRQQLLVLQRSAPARLSRSRLCAAKSSRQRDRPIGYDD